MIRPIRTARTKYYEHKGKICVGVGFAAGVGAALYCVKPAMPNVFDVRADMTADELAAFIKEHKAFDMFNPKTGKTVAIIASDYVE